MDLFDSHCHLDDDAYDKDLEQVLDRATAAGVTRMMTVGVTHGSSARAADLSRTRPGVYASVGVHPHYARSCSEKILERLGRMAGEEPGVRAWGEIGLDFNRMHSPRDLQEHWFLRQLDAAGSLDLPVILHERDTRGRLAELLERHFDPGRTGVVHCFSGDRADLNAYLEMGLFIGITGIVTVKTRGAFLRELAPKIPADRILIETDAPYLVPAPERNRVRRNEPAYVRSVLMRLAEVRGEDPETLARITRENACRLFSIDS